MTILQGDCIEVLKTLPDNSVDSIVTDPPYGWRFMGKAWDGEDIERDALRSLGPLAADPNNLKLCIDGKLRRRRIQIAQAAGSYDLSPSANESFQLWTEKWATEALRVLKPR